MQRRKNKVNTWKISPLIHTSNLEYFFFYRPDSFQAYPVNIFHLANVGEKQFSSSRNVGKMMASNVGPESSAPKSHFPPTLINCALPAFSQHWNSRRCRELANYEWPAHASAAAQLLQQSYQRWKNANCQLKKHWARVLWGGFYYFV